MRYVILLPLLMSVFTEGYSQSIEWQLLSEVDVTDVDLVSMDNRGNVFFSDRGGNVNAIDASGAVVNQYSPTLQARLTQLDAFSSVTLFLFSSDLQQTVLLDQHLVHFSTFSFSQEVFGIVKAAALGNGNVFWLFDEVTKSLKKYDYKRGELLQDQPLALILGDGRMEVSELQERKNLVYMHLKGEGIVIFDNQGNFLKKHAVRLDQRMSIYDDHLYYVKNESIHQLNLYTGEELRYQLPASVSKRKIMIGSDKIVFYSDDSMQIYYYKKPD